MGNPRLLKAVPGEPSAKLVMMLVPADEGSPGYQPPATAPPNAPQLQASNAAAARFADIIRLGALQTMNAGDTFAFMDPTLSALSMSVYLSRFQRARRMLLEQATAPLHNSASYAEARSAPGEHVSMSTQTTQTASLQDRQARSRRSMSEESTIHLLPERTQNLYQQLRQLAMDASAEEPQERDDDDEDDDNDENQHPNRPMSEGNNFQFFSAVPNSDAFIRVTPMLNGVDSPSAQDPGRFFAPWMEMSLAIQGRRDQQTVVTSEAPRTQWSTSSENLSR